MAEKHRWLGFVMVALICIPAFLFGYGAVTDFMQSPGQNAGIIETTIVGGFAGIITASASLAAYKRDLTAAL